MIVEQIIFGLKVGIFGMGIIFAGLIFIIGLVHVNKMLTKAINKDKNEKEPVQEAPKPAVKVQTATSTASASQVDNGSVVAAITAAVASALQADNGSVVAAITAAVSVMMEGTPFKVTSVKKAAVSQNTNVWDIVAIQEQNNNL